MSEGTTRITRTVETDLDADELWGMVADGDAWARWMVDESDVEVRPGSAGTVVDDGEARGVRIDRLDDHQLAFTWWPQRRPELASAVELVVLPAASGSRLHITETFLSASAVAAPAAWDVRLMLLVAQALAVHV
jgi:Activator of Hsp90 ATPase homolog 1-like protein